MHILRAHRIENLIAHAPTQDDSVRNIIDDIRSRSKRGNNAFNNNASCVLRYVTQEYP